MRRVKSRGDVHTYDEDNYRESSASDTAWEQADSGDVVFGRVKGAALINVRAAPDKNAEVIAQLQRFAPVRIDSEDGEYYCVTIHRPEVVDASFTGFIHKDYCEVI